MIRLTALSFCCVLFLWVDLFAFPQAELMSVRKTFEDSTQNTKVGKKSPRGAMLRSLAFPGWGQVYNKQYIKSVIVFSGVTFFVTQIIRFNRNARNAAPGSAERNSSIDKRNLQFWLIGATTMISMLDAYIDAILYDFDAGPSLKLRIGTIRSHHPYPNKPMPLGVTIQAKF